MIIGPNVTEAAIALRLGKLVGIPTETVYGLAGNALNEAAVSSIFQVKNRPFFDPLIVHIPNLVAVEKYAEIPLEADMKLLKHFWPGPLTYLGRKKHSISDLVTAGSPLVGLRVPNQPISLQLLEMLDFPLAAPSANPFGYVSPTTAQHVANQLGDKIAYILDGGPCQVGIESTIIGRIEGKLVVFRLGGTSIEEIEDVGQEKVAEIRRSSSKPDAPGMLSLHYSPHCRLILLKENEPPLPYTNTQKNAWIGFDKLPLLSSTTDVLWLSASGDIHEAARNVFRVLRQLDEQGYQEAQVRLLPESGLGIAINDRLIRAATQSKLN